MSDDLVERLRSLCNSFAGHYNADYLSSMAGEAADEITRLRAALGAEKLKRQQVELERDCLVESLTDKGREVAELRGRLCTALWMLNRWDASGLGRDAPKLQHETTNFLLSCSGDAALDAARGGEKHG